MTKLELKLADRFPITSRHFFRFRRTRPIMPWYPLLAVLTLALTSDIVTWTAGKYCLRAIGISWTATVLFLAVTQPGLLRRRRLGPENGSSSPDWDVRLLGWLRLSLLLMLAVAGGQAGRGDAAFQPTMFAIGAGTLLVGTMTLWASLYSNPFFETQVRHQKEHGQRVIQSGPYAWVRHPGYLALTLMLTSLPMMLQSSLAIWPCLLCVAILVVRLRREERFLHEQLDGYAAYTGRVRCRLIPLLW